MSYDEDRMTGRDWLKVAGIVLVILLVAFGISILWVVSAPNYDDLGLDHHGEHFPCNPDRNLHCETIYWCEGKGDARDVCDTIHVWVPSTIGELIQVEKQ